MKTLLTICFFFSMTLMSAQTYNGRVTYSISSSLEFDQSMSEDLEKEFKDKELLAQASSLLAAVLNSDSEVLIELKYNDQGSLLAPVESMEKDNLQLNFASITAAGLGVIFIDHETLISQSITDDLGERLIVIDSLSRFDWQLTNEKKTIGEYVCLKAVGKREVHRSEGNFFSPVEAWYTPQIPIPTGPAGYGGLPGLILELHETKDSSYHLKDIQTKFKKQIIIKRPKKGKVISRKEYELLYDKLHDDK